MRMDTRGVLVFVLAVILVGSAFAQEKQEKTDQAATEAPKQPDPWKEYVLSGKWTVGEEYFSSAILAECTGEAAPSFKKLARLHYARNICRYFPEIEKRLSSSETQRRFAAWLLANPAFTERLLLALKPRDDVARALEIVYGLCRSSEKQVKRYPELAIAFAVVWDAYPVDNQLLVNSFKYYTRYASKMRFDLRALPYEVTKYVVDTQRPVLERLWALKQYGSSGNVGRLYKMVQYDHRAYERGEEREIRQHEYTLQNIRRYKGLCTDAAVFASEVGKAAGVPSVYVSGPTESGIGHAWVGFLRKRGKQHLWDQDSGRIDKEPAWAGSVKDPQEDVTVSAHELALALNALRYPLARRRTAEIWRDVAVLLSKSGSKPRAQAAMHKSLETCVYDKSQWQTFARLARDGVFSSDQTAAAIARFADNLKHSPNLAADAFEQLIANVDSKSSKAYLRLYDSMTKKFSKDLDVVGRIRLLKGRYLEAAASDDAALNVYAESAIDTLKCRSVALPLLDNAGRLLVQTRKTKRAIALHQKLWARAQKPSRSVFAVYSTWFRIGLRLAKLHDLAGHRADHDRILRAIVGYQRVGKDEQDLLAARLARLDYRGVNRTSPPMPLDQKP